ncbi:hypothetical protein VT84_06615 [Gemmata sp. SH-PL17]|uniref:hypothetical protein n=1 Tax=Gemmata sp. SH-PL17 TaxID=1630693 RepID=UPI00078CB4BB|nr:hypothetical protein [Gemmata sp. SH-PL17]AMV24050.1 hypothetical protein VT84_06615 [Gemmata sp. SH-PL17]
MTDAQRAALAQVAVIALALDRLGGTATVAALSEGTGLPLPVVTRRLSHNGTSIMRPECRYFVKIYGGWRLTELGRALVGERAT